MDERRCPCGVGIMELKEQDQCIEVRGEQLTVSCRCYVCPCCGIESGCVEDVDEAQVKIAEAYRRKAGLVIGSDIRLWREGQGLSCEDAGAMLGLSSESFCDLEEVLVQSPELDAELRRLMAGETR